MDGRKPILIKDFSGGVNKFIDAIKLKINEFTEFTNLVILSYGFFLSAVKRDSIRRYNTNAPTNSATKITALYEFAQNRKSTNTLLLINTDTGVDKCTTTGTFTSLSGSNANTGKAKFLTFNDTAYIFGRQNNTTELVNTVYDGTTYTEIGTPPCPQTFTLTEISGGSAFTASGNYFYIITYIYDNNQESHYQLPNSIGAETDSTAGGTSNLVSTDFTAKKFLPSGPGKMVAITGIPTGNGRVTARKIYRTENGGTTFLKVATIEDNTTTTFIDNTADADLGEELQVEFILKPNISRYGCIHKRRIFKAYSTENQFDQLSIEAPPTTFTASQSAGGLTQATANQTTVGYKYKFATMSIITTATEPISTSNKPQMIGFFGKQTSAFPATLSYNGGGGNEDDTVTISSITQADSWNQRVAIFRNVSQIITGVSIASSAVLTISNGYHFRIGETVTVSGITGSTMPNGPYTVTAINDATHITINFNSTGGTYTSGGNIQGGTYYYLGNTGINRTAFVDKITDTDLISGQSAVRNFTQYTGNSTYGSLLEYSEINQGDIYFGANQIPINPDDNDVIKGIFNEPDGVVIFKDRGIYKLYTNNSDPANWQVRELLTGIGATEPYSIVRLPNYKYIFLSNNTFFLWQAGAPTATPISDAIQTDLNALTFTNIDACFDSNRDWVWITYSTSGVNGNILVYDLRIQKWYHFKKNTNDLGVRYPLLTKAGLILFASDYKRIMGYALGSDNRDESGSSWSNDAIQTILQTKVFDYNTTDFKFIGGKYYADNGDTLTVVVNVDGTDVLTETVTADTQGYNRFLKNIDKEGKRVYAKITSSVRNTVVLQSLMIHSEDKHSNNNKTIDIADYGN